jgi:uncharacterized protein with NRDE domain
VCIVLVEYDEAKKELFVLTNRDEFYTRKFDDHRLLGHVFCGIDHLHRGTWSGVSLDGRFAVLTNYRDMKHITEGKPTRGDLVLDYLKSDESAKEAADRISGFYDRYNGFNLLLFDGELWFVGRDNKIPIQLKSGIYTLSNGSLNSDWYKELRLKRLYQNLFMREIIEEDYLNILSDDVKAWDVHLKATGLNYETERLVSSIYIESESYGTVSKQLFRISPSRLVFKGLNRDCYTGKWRKLAWNQNFGYNNK